MIETFAQYLSAHPVAEIAFVVVFLLIVWYIMQLLRQPSIVWYIVWWILLSPQLHGIVSNQDWIELFAQIGISLLLFLVWLGLSPKIIKEVWKVSILTWWGQVIFTFVIWSVLAYFLWNDIITSVFIAIGLCFSSTIVIVKLISDRWDNNTLYGKISLWVLIVQDFIAMWILIAFALIHSFWDWWSYQDIAYTFGWIILAIFAVRCIHTFLLKKIVHTFSQSQEYLLLFSVWRALLLAAFFEYVWLTMEAWALIAWITLAESSKKYLIISKITPLRDFFIALFFVYIWGKLIFTNMWWIRDDVIVLSLFVLIGNPLIVYIITKWLWYDRKTSTMTGLTVAQISEFSFIVLWMWLSLWFIKSDTLLTTITFIWLITMTWSSYLFCFADKILVYIKKYLHIKHELHHEQTTVWQTKADIIIIWYWPHGQKLCHHLNTNFKLLVLERDPQIIEQQKDTPTNVTLLHADADTETIREELAQYNTEIIIITSSLLETNIACFHHNKKHPRYIIWHAKNDTDAKVLYEEWLDVVYISHEWAVSHTVDIIQSWTQKNFIENFKNSHREIIDSYLQKKKTT